MAKRRNRYESDALKKVEERRQQRLSSSVETKPTTAKDIGMRILGEKFGKDTFEDDLRSMTETVNDISGNWQTQETMQNTRDSVASMQKRINAYQSYQQRYGGEDLTDLSKGYKKLLRNWDDISEGYAGFENADAFNKARTKAQMDKKFSGLSYEDVQAELTKYDKDSDEYKYLSSYTNYGDLRDFDNALTGAKTNVEATRDIMNPAQKDNKYDVVKDAKLNASVANGSAIVVDQPEKGSQADYIRNLETLRNQYALDHKFDLYKEYMEAEDFAEKSQYVPSKGEDDKWWQDTSDETYEFINNVDGARARILGNHDKYQANAPIYTPSPYIERGLDAMNEEEIAVYNYLYAQDKELANKFLTDMEVTLTKRASDKGASMIEDAVDDSVFTSIGLSLASPIMNVGGGIYSGIDTVSSTLKGEASNPYNPYHNLTNTASSIREEVGENIAEATEGWEIFGQNIPSFLYQTGMSIADTTIGANGLGSTYTALMGLNSFQNTAKELTEAGASEEEILRGSMASGLFEMAFEKISLDNLMKVKNPDSLLKILKETAKQAGIEGSEEFFTETANVVFDNLNRGKNSDTYKMYEEYLARGFSEEEAEKMVKQEINKQIGWAFVGGAISGTVLGGTSATTQYHDLAQEGSRIRENDRVSEVMELQGLTPEESDAFKLYSEYANKGVTADNISDARIGNLYRTSERESYETLESKKTTTEQKADAINRLSKLANISTSKSAEEKAIQQRAESLNKGEVTEVTATGNSTKIEGIKIEDGKTIVRTGEGEFDVDAMTFSNKDAKLISYAESMGEAKGNLMLSQYDGKADVSSFVNSFDLAYSYGEIGMGVDSVLKNKGVLTEVQASEIYKTAMTNKSNERQRVIDEINEKHSSAVFVQGNFDDSIIDYDGTVTDGSKVAWKSLTKTQRNAITFAKGFSKATGVNITFIQSEVKDGKRVGKNGSYNPETNTIEIDVYAGIVDAKTVKDSIIPTLSHEMTHWMKAKSPAMYDKIREHALETLAMSGNLSSEERVASEMNRMKKAHSEMNVTEEMAIDEIVARYCEDMLANSNKTRKLLNQMSKKEQQSFISKVKDTFNNLMEWVNELLSQYKSSSKEAEILREYKNRLKEVSKMWDKALEEAIKSNQSLQAEGITGEQLIGENVITENTAQFSIRTYENEGRDLLHKWLENSDLSKKDKKNIIEQMDYVYDVATKYAQENDLVDFASWSDTDIIRRDDGTPILTVVVPNGEYPLNIDFSQICKKRKALNAVLNALVRSGDLDIRTLSQSDIGNINRIIKEHGFEIACALCFVDSKRYRVNEWADSFADTFNKLVKSLTKGTDYKVDEYNYTGRNVKQPEGKLLKNADDSELNFDYINEVLAKNSSGKAIYRYALAIKNNKELRSVLNSSEIISSAGLDAIKVQNELLYGLVNSHQGSAKPKLSHSENPYGYEILLDARFNAEDAYKVGGVRIQSFSDYMANMFFDYVQMIGDLSAKKLPAHAYTKEYYFAKLFGLTGIKINMSIVPKGADITDEQKARFNKMTKAMKEKDAEFKALKSHAGLDANGNYILEDETFPLDKALEIQNTKGYDKNCGIIWVGVSNAHINKMLDDENVPFIIPYHKSSLNPAIARMRNIDFYNDYTKAQNTRYDSKAKKKVPASVWSFDFYADLAKTNDPRQTAENYKTECQNRGYLPKFDEFANHPNYYKLLVDFRVYDANGNYAPQSAVKMEFPSDFNEIVGESLVEAQETQSKLDADMKGLLDEIRSELKLGTQNQQEQYSDRDYMDAVNRGDMETAQKMVDEVAKKKGYDTIVFHGTDAEKINVFVGTPDRMETNSPNLIKGYFSDQEAYANDYGRNTFKYYINTDNFLYIEGMFDSNEMTEYLKRHGVTGVKYNNFISDEEAVSAWLEDYGEVIDPWMFFNESGGNITEQIRKAGYKGVYWDEGYFTEEGGTAYMPFESNLIKSADAVTYDDQGNVIPLSKRFNTENADTRYSDREQTITSEDTSLNQTPATFTNYEFKSTDRILDWGGGKYDTAKKAMEATYKGIKFEVVDTFNRTKSHNDRILDEYSKEKANVLTINNVLNVINSEAVIESVVEESKNYLAEDGICYIAIYEGSKDGNSKETSAGWQNNQPASWYVPFVEKHYKYVRRQGSFIIASDSDIAGRTSKISTDTKATLKQNTDALKKENLNMKHSLYSDRDNVSVYDAMGETERLIDENARLKADIETLKANISDDEVGIKKFRSLADYLKKLAGSQYNRETLGDELKEVYTYIQTTDDLQWNNVFAKTYDVARRMMNLNPNVSTNYFKEVMSNVRKDKVTLSEDQRADAEKLFGNYGDFHRAVFGRINVVKEGTPLSEMWKEWSKKYPAIFDANLGAEKQVEALVDIVNALKASSSMMGEYEQEEAIRHLATEIYNQFWNIASDKSDAVQKAKANHRKMMEDLRKEYEQRQKEKTLHPVGETALKYEKLLRQTMQRDKAEVKKARELGKKRLDDYKDRAERNAKIQTITKKAMTLNQWLTKNSRDEHIPEVMKAPVAYLLNAIDFSSKQLLGMRGGSNAGMPTKKDLSFSKALEQVHDMVQKINSAQIGENEITEIYGTFADFPAGFADDIRELSSSVNDVMRTVGDNAYVLNEMTLEQLETLDKIVTIIKSTVSKMNKFLAIRHAEGVANLSQQSIVEMDQLGKIKTHEGWRGKIDKLVDWGNALPHFVFKRFGTGGQKVYEALQDGWDKFAFHVKAIIDYAESVYTSDEVKEWSKDIKTFDVLEPATEEAKASKDYKPKYQKVQMTVPQIMSLYCLQKREQAKGHLMGGGMRVSDIKVKNNVISQTDGVILSQSEIDTIVNSLTGRQKKVADALQKFMNTVCTDWGNEISMLRFGFEGFGEDNYFPIQSDKNNLAVNDETEQNNSLFRLLNMSFTKGTIQNANNRIVISDIFDVFAQHTSDMAKYNALALPVLDSFKWYNYKEKAQKGETQFVTKSLKQSMENAFGKDAQNYFTTFLRDINGEHSAGRDSVGGGFFTNAKIASVGFNMRVVALQPTSYLRASAVIDTKYLAKALTHKPKTSMAEKHCGIALWKSLGFYDINVQNGVADMIKHEETIKDRIVEASMKGAEVADKITWGYLWNACELEVRDKQKNLKVGSKEFYEAIASRLREVIYSTQVVDSTMTRSHMMRSKDGRDKMLTAFASEPTISYNMLQDVYYDWKLTERRTGSKQTAFAQNGKKMARVITAYTVTNMMCALVEAGFDVFRDDEDEMTTEEFMELYLKNFGSDMSILGKIPYAKEIISMMQGYSSSRTDTQWMQYLANTFNGVLKLAEGKGNAYTTAKNFMRAFSQATGLPFYNAYRDFMALLDEVDILTADEVEGIFNDTIGNMFPSLKSK